MEGIPLRSDGVGGEAASFVIISPVKKLRTYPSPKKRQQLQQQQQLQQLQQQLLQQQLVVSQPANSVEQKTVRVFEVYLF
jgi:hypothetical protein